MLTEQEAAELSELETQVDYYSLSIHRILKEIKGKQLFRSYGTWEKYLRSRFGYSLSWWKQLTASMNELDRLLEQDETLLHPHNEYALRVLRRYDLEMRSAIWDRCSIQAIATGQEKVSASIVKAVAETMLDVIKTDHVDTGDDQLTPITAAITQHQYEAHMRQREYIKAAGKQFMKMTFRNGDVFSMDGMVIGREFEVWVVVTEPVSN